MKIRFKHQKFQADAAKAVCDVFSGQPFCEGAQNQPVELEDDVILEQINKIQSVNNLVPSKTLDGRYNLTVEMETGVGKTYTYIKTMYELNRRYGWSKYIIVVPSIAIREGVYKSMEMTREHFAEEYGKKIRFFIYDSAQMAAIDSFAADSAIHAMIINAQAFNARGKDARRIYMQQDEFQSRRPMDILAGTRPIVIIDEPQSVEGKQTKEHLKDFRPLFTLRYSATHRSDSIYNRIYRLDALDAYEQKLVKKIAVKGITGAEEEDEEQIRRHQIRETVMSHIQKERQLYAKGIKVLSLFFIDEVAKYRQYDGSGKAVNGIYAKLFEEEYRNSIEQLVLGENETGYRAYLDAIPVAQTHTGYFSIDKKGRMVESKGKGKESISDDCDAYDLIMKNKELLLDQDPERSPVRFVFSHSALREGWDNPNVFQICTLKQSSSEVRKRQEVGRGLRLCVNQSGERMDSSVLGDLVHRVNVLTVIASDSYENFAQGLQQENAEAVAGRPEKVVRAIREGSIMQPEDAYSGADEQMKQLDWGMLLDSRELWKKVKPLDTAEIIKEIITAMDREFTVEEMETEQAKFGKIADTKRPCDLIGELAEGTGFTRADVSKILTGIGKKTFDQFRTSPEVFIRKSSMLINKIVKDERKKRKRKTCI